MTYHVGAPLVQTLFTSRYLLQLQSLTSTLLNAESTSDDLLNQIIIPYMHSFRLCMYLVWTELTRGHMYDGEDFASDTAGLWEGGKEWSVPRLGSARVDGLESVGDGLGYDECDLMLEDVVERMEAGLEWLETAGCELAGSYLLVLCGLTVVLRIRCGSSAGRGGSAQSSDTLSKGKFSPLLGHTVRITQSPGNVIHRTSCHTSSSSSPHRTKPCPSPTLPDLFRRRTATSSLFSPSLYL